MRSPVLAIIGGTGLEEFIDVGSRYYKETMFGTVNYVLGSISDVDIMFIPRHGFKHENPPHKVPYKANIDLIAAHNISKVIAFSAVGSLRYDLKPGSIVIPNQLIDYSLHGETFYDFDSFHVDFTFPYCRDMGLKAYQVLRERGIDVGYGYTYVSTYGPRFESAGEIEMLRRMGADIVGMTNVPESVLAREAGLHYMLISIVSNYAAGMQDRVTSEEVYDVMASVKPKLKDILHILVEVFAEYEPKDGCSSFRDTFRDFREVRRI